LAGSESQHSPTCEPLPSSLPESLAVAIAFVIITALHIVLGELAPKSLAASKVVAEKTATRS
jgi:CBS domain containing-hemolysin-like protein